MKKRIGLLCGVFVFLGVSANAFATPYTWEDTITNHYYIGNGKSYEYSHDLKNNVPVNFVPGEDFITSYTLTIDLSDDKDNWCEIKWEMAYVDQPGLFEDGFYTFSYDDKTFGCSLLGLISLNKTGVLTTTIYSILGDFYFDQSVLVAEGSNNDTTAPVPEPATMLLLGTGFIGIATISKKKLLK